MKEFIIGKEGDQNFEIKSACVSRRHAKITINNGRWTLEDLDSTNGTFIQGEDGEFVQVKKVEVGEFTRIALGATNATGHYFYPHHLLEEKGGYEAEMRHVLDLYGKLQGEKAQIEADKNKQGLMIRLAPPVISLVLMGIIMFLFPEYRMYAFCIGTAVSVLSGLLTGTMNKHAKKLKALAEKQTRLIRCPKCNRPLSAIDIENEQCAACKTHA